MRKVFKIVQRNIGVEYRGHQQMRRQRSTLERFNLTPVNLTRLQPVISRRNILLMEAIHDLFAPKEDIERLWRLGTARHLAAATLSLHLDGLATSPARSAPAAHTWFVDEILHWLAPRLESCQKNTDD